MINIFCDKPIRMPETCLPSYRSRLNGLKLLRATLFQGFDNWFERVNLDCQPRRFKGRTLLGWPGDDQHGKTWRGDGGQLQPRLGIGKTQRLLTGQQDFIEFDGSFQIIHADKNPRVSLQNHHASLHWHTRKCRYIGVGLPTTLVLLSLFARPAAAQWVVFDPSNYAQNVLTAARELQQVDNEIQGLTDQAQMLANQAKNLTSLPLSTLTQLEASVQHTEGLISQVQNIAFNVQQVEQAFTSTYGAVPSTASDAALIAGAQARWQNSVGAFEDSLKIQAGVVGNISANANAMRSLVSASQNATGALQAAQAGNQLLALQSQQLSDLVAVTSAKARADALAQANTTTTEAESKALYNNFAKLKAYTPGHVTMFGGR